MEARQHKSLSFLERPLVKSHSCYCEAKGPIVEEGFVAARIRAIQGAYNPTSVSSWSHSPMVLCLMYQRLEKQGFYPLSKTQMPPKAFRRPPIRPAGKPAATLSKAFLEGNLGKGLLNEPGHISSGGEIGVETRKNEFDGDAQASQQSSSKNTKKQVQEDTLNSMPIPLNMQGMTHTDRHLVQLRGTTKDKSDGNIFGRKGGEKNQPAQPIKAWFAEELGDILDHASQRHNTVDEGHNTTHISSSNLTSQDGERKDLQGEAPCLLKSSPTSHLSLRLLIKKSFASLLLTTGGESTSPEDNPRPKKHPVRHKTKEQVVHGDRIEDPLTAEPRDTGQPFFHPLDSPMRAQRAFTLQPSAHVPSNTPEPIELRFLSTTHMRSPSHHQDDHVLPGQNCVNQFSGRAEPQGSITPNKSPRRSSLQSPSLLHQIFPSASENHRSALSAASSPQGRRNWSWWKLLLADTESDTREILDEGSNLSVGDKVEPEDTRLLPKDSDMEYFTTRPSQEAKTTPTISELKHDENHEISPTKLGDNTLKANESRIFNHIQLPLEPRTLPSASSEPDPALPRQPKPKQAQQHLSDWVANLPLEPLSQGSSGAASPVRLKVNSSNGSSKQRNTGQKFKRIQIIVTLDGSSDVMVEASMKRMRMSGEGEGGRGVGAD
ncbi:hypothetical protein MMC29_000871 [Sticta canariensis]|nr:hypothetical protein [Sticta canariensis]